MTGRFITFEGGEGAGKSTQVERLAARLDRQGIAVRQTREPGGTPTAEVIRDFILEGEAKSLGPAGEAFLFAAAREDHVDKVIRPALASGEWVICDRFIDSTRVYQGTIGGVDSAVLRVLEDSAVGDSRPDLTLILDVPAEIGLERAIARSAETGRKLDRFESEDMDAHETRRMAFLDIAAADADRCVVIDASGDASAVAESVWLAVRSRLLEAGA